MTIEEFAHELEQAYFADCSEENARRIAARINRVHMGGAPLTAGKKEEILQRIEGVYIDGIKKRLNDSDNAAWLKAVSAIRASVDGIMEQCQASRQYL